MLIFPFDNKLNQNSLPLNASSSTSPYHTMPTGSSDCDSEKRPHPKVIIIINNSNLYISVNKFNNLSIVFHMEFQRAFGA